MDELLLKELVGKGFNHIPICREIITDIETPLSVYLKLADKPYSYLFESVEEGEKWGRYSIIGLQAETVIKITANNIKIYLNSKCIDDFTNADPLIWIEDFKRSYKVPELNDTPHFDGGLVGYFGYETIQYIEPKLANTNNKDDLGIPDIMLMVSNDLLVFDNLKNTSFLITHINPKHQTITDANNHLDDIYQKLQENIITKKPVIKKQKYNFVSLFGEDNFCSVVNKIKDYIIKGDVMQVVPSQRLVCDFNARPIDLYRSLRKLNPSPYMYFLNMGDFYIVGSSPEILTRIDNNTATLRPLAGTRGRGNSEKQDKQLEKELLADEKELAEHLMLIDLGRNDLGRIAKTNSVKVTDKMAIERYSHVMHIVSNISCELKDNISPIDVIRATFPAGTLSGAPKVRAMEIIAELETLKRGVYSGAVGYLSFSGAMDLAIAIRTAVIKDNKLFIQAGAGVVYDSDPQSEWQETMQKAMALMNAADNVHLY